MDDLEINALFEQVSDKTQTQDQNDQPEPVKKVFSVLLTSTLAFRDRVQNDEGVVVTVEDVRIALDWLFEFMQTQKLPESNNSPDSNDSLRLKLFNSWIEELNKSI